MNGCNLACGSRDWASPCYATLVARAVFVSEGLYVKPLWFLLQVLTLIQVFPPRRLAQKWQVLTHRPAEITRLFTGGEG